MGDQTSFVSDDEDLRPNTFDNMNDQDKELLYNDIRAVEELEEEIKELRDDSNERKTLCCERLGIEKDVLSFVLKRRKKRPDARHNFDDTVSILEEAVQEIEGRKSDEARARIEAVRSPAPESAPIPETT